MLTNPKVSIVIPVYNREKIIGETLDSVLLQDYSNYEIIVCDNCSTDKTWDILKFYTEKYDNLRVFRNYKNLGPVRNWLACLEKVRGTYVKILWSDDLITKDFLSKTVPILENNKDIGFIYTLTNIFSDNSNSMWYKYGSTGRYLSRKFIYNHFLGHNQKVLPVSPGNALFRTKDVIKNLMVEIDNPKNLDFSKYGAGNDLLIFLLIANEYKYFYFINEPLSLFRVHSDSITINKGNDLSEYYLYAKVFFLKEFNKVLKKRDIDKFYTSIYVAYKKKYRYMLLGINYKFRIPILLFSMNIIRYKISSKLFKNK